MAAVLLSVATAMGPTAAEGQAGVEISVRDAVLTPAEASAGEDITVRSVGTGCVSGSGERSSLVWAVFPHGEFVWGEQLGWSAGDAIASGSASPGMVGGTFGAWTTTFPAPDPGETPPGGEIGPGSPVTSPVLSVYGPLPFTVDGHQLDFVAKCLSHPANIGDITITPEVPELGGTATITTDDPCPMPHTQGGAVDLELWQVAASASFPTAIDTVDLGPVAPADDGSWSATFDVPAAPDHRYAISAHCRNAEGGPTLGYWLTPFDVQAPDGGPIETPPGFWDDAPTPPATGPVASPAQPVSATPTYTG
jgi:hypothetical protein